LLINFVGQIVVLSPPHKKFKSKSPLILLLLISLLALVTLIAASTYFLRPIMETEIKEKVVDKMEEKGHSDIKVAVSGRDVTIEGTVTSEEESTQLENVSSKVQGVREIKNKLLIKK
jgi:hypothetical protein